MKPALQLFKNKYPVIAALHYLPSPGFEGYVSFENAQRKAMADLSALIQGGIDAIIVENNYDIPHGIKVGLKTVTYMKKLTSDLVRKSSVPVGVSVLWNDYETAFSIALATGATFIRIPAFVDDVITDYGQVRAVAEEALLFRWRIGADDIAIFADVQVKHAEMVDKFKNLKTSVEQAVSMQADGIIATGNWTGDPPTIKSLQEVQAAAHGAPVIIGSGANAHNIGRLKQFSDGVIVSTSLKAGMAKNKQEEVNLKSADATFDIYRIKEFMHQVRSSNL